MITGAVHRGLQPFGGPLFDRMGRIAGDGLKNLRHHAVRISREQVVEGQRTQLGLLEVGRAHPQE
jgi:hypothetical protein